MNRTLNILKCLLLMVVVGALIVPSATAIANMWDELDTYVAGEVDPQYIGFQLQQNLPADGKIKIVYPEGFNISSAIKNTGSPNLYHSGGNEAYTLVIDVPSRTLTVERSGSGGVISAGWTVYFFIDNIKNPNIAGTKTITAYTTLSNDVFVETGSTNVEIIAGPANHFTIDPITPNPEAGADFTVVVTALDQYNNIDTNYGDVATLSSTIGVINPTTIDFDDGNWDGIATTDAYIETTGTGNVTATKGSLTGASNTFTVTPAALASFEIAAIPNQFDEQPFTITAKANDTYNNYKTDYTGLAELTVNPGTPGDVTVTPANIPFVNGVFSGQVTLNVDPNPTLGEPHVGASLSIEGSDSNEFNISLLPVDLVNSTVIADPTTVIEDDISTSTVTVTVKNAINQNIIQGVSVTLESDRPWVNIVAINAITDSNGTAKFAVSSHYELGSATFTAKVLGTQAINQKPVVTFGFDNKLRLNKGWNLVSVPRTLDNSSVSALNTNKVDKIYYYDTVSGVWKSAFYTSGNWSGTLTTIDDGKGYWMNATDGTEVQVVLKTLDPLQLPPEYPLKAGWNMVGYTSLSLNLNTDIDTYFSSLRNLNNGFPIWVSAYIWENGGYRQAKPGGWQGWNSFDNAMRTEGYWVYLNSDGTLVP